MSTYPIKLLKDENQRPFIPFVLMSAVFIDGTDKTVASLFADIYTKEEIDQIIQNLGTLQRLCGRVPTVEDLPNDPNPGDTYIVGPLNQDCDEYMYVGDAWERLGKMTDLSGYYTSSETDAAIEAKAVALTAALTDSMDNKDLAILNTAKAYAEGQATAASASAIASAKTYTDTTTASGDASTLASAKDYADSAAANALADAKTYADTGDTNTLNSAKGYTDTAIAGINVPTKVSDLNNDTGFITGLFEATYNVTPYADIKAAVDAHKIVYCKISSGRYAFLAYSGGSYYEFQYYRSNTTHDFSNRDEVFVYKITKGNNSDTWETIQRKTELLYKAGTGINMSTPNNNSETTVSLDSNKVLLKDNTNAWTPTGNYQPATKKYVDDAVAGGGGGGGSCNYSPHTYISTSSSTDYGTTTNRVALHELAKGIHVFRNNSSYTQIQYSYKKTGLTDIFTGNTATQRDPISNTSLSFKTFVIEVFEDMSDGFDNFTAGQVLARITLYDYSDYRILQFSVTPGSYNSPAFGVIHKETEISNIQTAYNNANSANTTANQAAQQASTNAQAITALDTRVTALEQGGGGGATYLINPMTKDTMYTNTFTGTGPSQYDNFWCSMRYDDYTVSPPAGSDPYISIRYMDTYISAPQTQGFTIQNLAFAFMDAQDNIVATSTPITFTMGGAGGQEPIYSGSDEPVYFPDYVPGPNAPFDHVALVSLDIPTPGAETIPIVQFADILTAIPSAPTGAYYIDLDKIAALNYNHFRCIINPYVYPADYNQIYISDSTSSRQLYDLNINSVGFIDVTCFLNLYENATMVFQITDGNAISQNTATYKVNLTKQGTSQTGSVFTLNWQQY